MYIFGYNIWFVTHGYIYEMWNFCFVLLSVSVVVCETIGDEDKVG